MKVPGIRKDILTRRLDGIEILLHPTLLQTDDIETSARYRCRFRVGRQVFRNSSDSRCPILGNELQSPDVQRQHRKRWRVRHDLNSSRDVSQNAFEQRQTIPLHPPRQQHPEKACSVFHDANYTCVSSNPLQASEEACRIGS